MKKGKADKLGLCRIYSNETIYELPVYVAKNGKVVLMGSSKRNLKLRQEQAEKERQTELGEGWVIYPAFVRVDIEKGSIEYDIVDE